VLVSALIVLGSGAACSDGDDGGGAATSSSVTTTGPEGTAAGGAAPDAVEAITTGVVLRPVVAGGLEAPTAMAPRPSSDELWITEQGGTVRRVTVSSGSDPLSGPAAAVGYELDREAVLDLGDLTRAAGERGLLGIAFSADGRQVYVHHTDPAGDVVVAEYQVPEGDGARVDPGTRRVLLTIEHRRFANHNGGQLALGPDGFLYVGVGDGGGAGDPDRRAQDTDDLLGKVLRIDPTTPSGGRPYGIPPGNPFTDGGGAPEVFAYGARNPWRFSFDRATDDLWVADVGQNQFEEIDWLPASRGGGAGANLGWSWFEGDERFRTDGDPPADVVAPIFTYDHSGANCSVTGGYVYRGEEVPALRGVYLYGDYCGGEVRGLLARDGVVLDEGSLGATVPGRGLVTFGQDAGGELYVLSAEGALLKVEGA
jgi:glucose/arabinose dehydrogenase